MPKTVGATRLSRRLTPRTMMDGKALLLPWPPSAVVHELRSIPHFDGADMTAALPVHETLFTVVAPGREHCSMSWVANLMVQADRADAGLVQRLDEWLQAAPRRDGTFGPRGVGSLRSLTNPLDHTWGGWKNPECDLWAGALNHADLEALLDCIRSLPWRHAGRLQVFLMDQEESYFRLYMFRDGRLQQFTPPPPPNADDQHAW